MPIKKSRSQIQREKQEKQRKESQLKKLKSSIGNMKLFGVSSDTPEQKPSYNPRYEDDKTPMIRSNNASSNVIARTVKLSGEMLVREKVAQEELKRKSKRVAPMYNKGAYQYITDDTDPTTLGRKI